MIPFAWRLRVRELACVILGHHWHDLTGQYEGRVKVGRYCGRCFAASAREYAGQYPLRRG